MEETGRDVVCGTLTTLDVEGWLKIKICAHVKSLNMYILTFIITLLCTLLCPVQWVNALLLVSLVELNSCCDCSDGDNRILLLLLLLLVLYYYCCC